MFFKRLISSIALWAALLAILFYLPAQVSAVFYCFVLIVATWEFYGMLQKGGFPCFKKWGIMGGTLLAIGTWYCEAYEGGMTGTFEILFLVFFAVALCFRQLANRNDSKGISLMGNTLLGLLYIPLLFGFIPKIKYLFGGIHGPGGMFVLYLFLVTKFGDVGAYASGRVFGRHKMVPRISPNKTWEGLAGGFVAAMVASITGFKCLQKSLAPTGFDFHDALILGLLLGGMGAMGDLVESMLKREVSAKDSGGILPGIGGVLDLIDSLLFTAPTLYAYLILVVKAG